MLFVFLRGVYITFNELIESTRKWDMEDTILYAMVLRSLISMVIVKNYTFLKKRIFDNAFFVTDSIVILSLLKSGTFYKIS